MAGQWTHGWIPKAVAAFLLSGTLLVAVLVLSGEVDDVPVELPQYTDSGVGSSPLVAAPEDASEIPGELAAPPPLVGDEVPCLRLLDGEGRFVAGAYVALAYGADSDEGKFERAITDAAGYVALSAPLLQILAT